MIVIPATPSDASAAQAWAERLGVLCIAPTQSLPKGSVGLRVAADGLALGSAGGTWVHAEVAALRANARRGRELLMRAVGRPTQSSFVLDATAGLGRDGFLLAAHGHRVIMVERVPIVAALLEDALARARAGGGDVSAAAARIRLIQGDAAEVMATLTPGPEVVMIDPMYPVRGKTAQPNKGMALFRALIGDDHDAEALLERARRLPARRVIVKRPIRAEPLGGQRPSGSIRGSTTRWDIYPAAPPGSTATATAGTEGDGR